MFAHPAVSTFAVVMCLFFQSFRVTPSMFQSFSACSPNIPVGSVEVCPIFALLPTSSLVYIFAVPQAVLPPKPLIFLIFLHTSDTNLARVFLMRGSPIYHENGDPGVPKIL